MTAKKITKKIADPETDVAPTRMFTIILKEKDHKGRFMFMDVDQVIPVHPFGEQFPTVMGVVDDKAYFVPHEQMNWFEQNYGIKKDTKIAKAMFEEAKKRNEEYVEPMGAEFV